MAGDDKKEKLVIYPKLSYKVVGCLFDVWNDLGFGHKEKFYQRAIAIALENKNINFEKEKLIRVKYKGEDLGVYYLDFLIENKIILEIKVRNYFSKQDIEQLYNYLKVINLKLGIIAHFTKSGVKFKRVLNIK